MGRSKIKIMEIDFQKIIKNKSFGNGGIMQIDLDIDTVSLLIGIIIGMLLLMFTAGVISKFTDDGFSDRQLRQLEFYCKESR